MSVPDLDLVSRRFRRRAGRAKNPAVLSIFQETSTEANSHTYYYYYHMPEGDTYPDNPHDNVDWIRAGSGDHHPEVGGVEQRDVDLYHSSIHERDFTNSANVGIIITACNIVLNLLLIALVLMRRSTRLQFVYQQVG